MANYWTQLSIEYANQRDYLDQLYRVYPIISGGQRDIDQSVFQTVEQEFYNQDNVRLIQALLQLKLFPIKDSFVAYLRKDPSALERNPQTVNRICGRLYELGLKKIYENCSQPKETNRQIGPMFRNWLHTKAIGLAPVNEKEFLSGSGNAILDGSDKELKDFAAKMLGFKRKKGLDFVGRFNGKYVIGEAKFISDDGGHQNAQFNDAMDTLKEPVADGVVKIAVIDGVPYIKSKNKIHKELLESDKPILSALLLRDFLYQI